MKKMLLSMMALISFICVSCTGEKKDAALILYDEVANPRTVNVLTEKQKLQGWQLLFDGKTGAGWHGYNQQGIPDFWAIEDGALTMNSVGGGEEQDIITDRIFENYAFTVEYKLTTGANSGIIYQLKEDPKYKYPYETGAEFQIVDEEGYPRALDSLNVHGANYSMYGPMVRPYLPIGEWNRLLLLVDGNEVTHVLNGVVVVKYTKYSSDWTALRNSGKWSEYPDYGRFDEGNISLQNHGTKVWFRDIKIKEF